MNLLDGLRARHAKRSGLMVSTPGSGPAPVVLLLFALVLLAPKTVPAADPIQVVVTGVEGQVLENVRAALTLPPGLVQNGTVNRLWLKRFVRQAPQKVRKALAPFGYYEPKVDVRLEEQNGQGARLEVAVQTGRPVRVAGRRLQIEGHRHRRLVMRLDQFPLRPGDVLRHDLYEEAKGHLKALALNLGYLDARFSEHTIRVDREQRTAEIFLTLDTGPRYRFGDFHLHGAPRYPDRFLRRYLAARPGEIFSFEKLGRTQQNYLDSDRFRNVVVTPRQGQAEDFQVPVDIRMEPVAERNLRPGIGFGTDTGARFSLRYQDLNVGDLGHELKLDLLLAQRRQNALAEYILPGYRNVRSLFALRGGYEREELKIYDTEYLYAEAEGVYGFRRGRQGSLYLRFQSESSEIAGDKVSSTFLMPGARYQQLSFDDQVRPKRGYRFRLEARGTRRGLLSDITLLQVLGDAKLLIPLPWRFFLHLRANASTTWQEDPIENIPASLRFFTGGDKSVRGYAFQSLGPENEEGETIGGKHLLVGSLELEKRFARNWGVAVFYDTGNTFDSFSDFRLARSVGLGTRYYTPVGPLRVDLARQIGEDEPSYRLHVGIGFGW